MCVYIYIYMFSTALIALAVLHIGKSHSFGFRWPTRISLASGLGDGGFVRWLSKCHHRQHHQGVRWWASLLKWIWPVKIWINAKFGVTFLLVAASPKVNSLAKKQYVSFLVYLRLAVSFLFGSSRLRSITIDGGYNLTSSFCKCCQCFDTPFTFAYFHCSIKETWNH